MATPKKPVKNDTSAKGTGVKRDEKPVESTVKKRVVDDDDDEDFDIPLDDLGRYESFDGYDDDDDY